MLAEAICLMLPLIKRTRRSHILGAAALVIMPVAIFAPAGITVVLFLTAVGVITHSRPKREEWTAVSPWLAAILAAVVFWGAVSSAWSITPMVSLTRSLRVATVFAAGFLLVNSARTLLGEERTRLGWLICAVPIIGILLLAVEIVTGMSMLRALRGAVHTTVPEFLLALNRASTVLALSLWPAVLILVRSHRWVQAVLLMTAGFAVLSVLESASAIVGTAAGTFMFGLAYLWPVAARRLLLVGILGAIVLAPVLPRTILEPNLVWEYAPWLPISAHHRLHIWVFTADAVLQRPVLGWGMDAARSLPGGKTLVTITPPPAEGEAAEAGAAFAPVPRRRGELLPLHPHNAALQVWLELGMVGVGLAMGLVALTVSRVGRLSREKLEGATVSGFISTVFVIAYFGYGIWQTWWLAALWLCTAFTLASLHGDTAQGASVDCRRENAAAC